MISGQRVKPTLCRHPTSSKILERSAASQLNDHLSTNKLYVPVQSAYRQKHSTETALLRVVNDLLLSIDSGKASMLVLLDLSAAFDTVDHDILVNRLRDSFCIQDKALSWFQSYLSDRTQTVRVFDVSSKRFPLLFGAPQGTVLGPPLYTCYSSPTYEIAKRRGIISHFFADDSQFQQDFVMDDDHVGQLGAYDRMSDCIGETADWMAQNRCKLNDPKTDFMLVYSDRRARKPAPLKLRVGDCELEPVQKVKNLGVILDSHLSMEAQVNSICRRAYFHLRSIGLIRKHLDLQTTKILVHAFVASTLDYCNSLLIGLPAKLLKKLQLVQNASARLIFRLRKNEHITSHLKELHWLPVQLRIEFKIVTLVHQCLHGVAPVYLSDLIIRRDTGRVTRSSQLAQIAPILEVPPPALASFGERSFKYAAPRLWNGLPAELRSTVSFLKFKSSLKTYYFKLAFPE